MNYEVYSNIIKNLDKEQKEKFTELVAIYYHNSLEKIDTKLFLALKNNLPDGIYVEGGLGILTIKDYPRSKEQSDKAMEKEKTLFSKTMDEIIIENNMALKNLKKGDVDED